MQMSSPEWGGFSSKKRGPVLIMCLRFSQAGEVWQDRIHPKLKVWNVACYCRPKVSQKWDKRGSGGRRQTGWLDSDRHLSCSFVSFCPISTPSPGSTWRAPGQFTSPGLTGSKGRGAQCKSCRHFDSSLMMALNRYLLRRPCAECRKQHSFHMEPFPIYPTFPAISLCTFNRDFAIAVMRNRSWEDKQKPLVYVFAEVWK